MISSNTLFKDDISAGTLMDLISNFQQSRIVLTACELDLFNALGNDSKTASQVSSDIQTNENATERLLDALVALNLIEKNGNLYSNNDVSLQYLVKGSANYFSNILHLNHLWNNWSKLTEVVKTGEPVARGGEKGDFSFLEDFVSAMHFRAKHQSVEITDLIDFSRTLKVLDLGGCSGTYSMEFSRAKPLLKCTIFDNPQVIPITKKYLENAGFSYKIDTLSGDFFKDDLGTNYDLIFVSNIIHSYSLWANVELLGRCYNALNKGGEIVIHEFILNDDKTSPTYHSIFNLNMLINTKDGQSYTETDILFMLKESWFTFEKRKNTSFGTGLIFARK